MNTLFFLSVLSVLVLKIILIIHFRHEINIIIIMAVEECKNIPIPFPISAHDDKAEEFMQQMIVKFKDYIEGLVDPELGDDHRLFMVTISINQLKVVRIRREDSQHMRDLVKKYTGNLHQIVAIDEMTKHPNINRSVMIVDLFCKDKKFYEEIRTVNNLRKWCQRCRKRIREWRTCECKDQMMYCSVKCRQEDDHICLF